MAEIRSSTWSTTAGDNNASPPDGWPEGQSPSSINNCAREMMAALKRAWNDDHPVNASTGSNSAYQLITSASSTAYATGDMYVFRANHESVGTSSLNVNGVGALLIKKFGDIDTVSGDIKANQIVQVAYEPSADVWQLLTAVDTPNLSDLPDVDLSGGAGAGDALIYDGSSWSAATAGAQTLNELSDVSASSPSTDDILVYDGSVWAPTQLDIAADVKTTLNATGDAPVYACRAWVNFDGTKDSDGNSSTANTPRLIRASGNVSSVVRNDVGDYTVNFETAMPDAGYVFSGNCARASTNALVMVAGYPAGASGYTASSLRIYTTTSNGNVTGDGIGNSNTEVPVVNVMVFR